ncbi:MAG: GlxA family transcriptional regulator, partial [Pseudomonadota bacterium]
MSKPETFVFLLIEDFTHLAFACAIEPLRIANLVAERELYRWRLASEDGARAICSNRSVTLVDQGLEPLQRDERLFVISGLGVRERI